MTADPNLMARGSVLQDHLDETMRAGAGTLRELVEAHGAEMLELDGARATRDRVCVVADEAFGPFPVQSAEDALTEIENGIGRVRRNAERVRAVLAEVREYAEKPTELTANGFAIPGGAVRQGIGMAKDNVRNIIGSAFLDAP